MAGADICLFSTAVQTRSGVTQTVQCVTCVKLITHLHVVLQFRMCGAIALLTHKS